MPPPLPPRIPHLSLPPRPPSLPLTPPSPGQGEPFLANDAVLAQWISEFGRVMHEAWNKLNQQLMRIDERLTQLESPPPPP
jgi:hypothetical protein